MNWKRESPGVYVSGVWTVRGGGRNTHGTTWLVDYTPMPYDREVG